MDFKKISKFFKKNKKEDNYHKYNDLLENRYLDETNNVNFREGILKTLLSLSLGLISFKSNKEATEAVLNGTTYSKKSTLIKFSIAMFFQLVLSCITMVYSGISLGINIDSILYALLFIFLISIISIFITFGLNYVYSYYIKYASFLFGSKKTDIKKILNLNAYWFTSTTLTFVFVKLIGMILSICLGKVGVITSVLITDIYLICVLFNYGRSFKFYLKINGFKMLFIQSLPIFTLLGLFIIMMQYIN